MNAHGLHPSGRIFIPAHEPQMKTRIVLVGCGTVGRGFLEILDGKAESLKKKHGFRDSTRPGVKSRSIF
jgi:hypothetical protein